MTVFFFLHIAKAYNIGLICFIEKFVFYKLPKIWQNLTFTP